MFSGVSSRLVTYFARRQHELQAEGSAHAAKTASADAHGAHAEFSSVMNSLDGSGGSQAANVAGVPGTQFMKDRTAHSPAVLKGPFLATGQAQTVFQTEVQDSLSIGSASEAEQFHRYGSSQASLDWRAATSVVPTGSADASPQASNSSPTSTRTANS